MGGACLSLFVVCVCVVVWWFVVFQSGSVPAAEDVHRVAMCWLGGGARHLWGYEVGPRRYEVYPRGGEI